MPTLGPSLLFAAGLTLGVGAGVFLPRKPAAPVPAAPVALPAAPGEKPKTVSLATPAGAVVLAGGHPGPTFDLIKRQAYTAAYDRRMKHPAWTAEHLTTKSLRPEGGDAQRADRQKSMFLEDVNVPELFRAKLNDYFRSGYDRGHMVPAADAKISQQAMDETFYLSNIAPQVGEGFNRHYWAYVEDFCRRLTSNFEDVYVFTIPLYMPTLERDGKWRVSYEVIGSPPAVSVPTHFAKVVLASRPDFAHAQKPSQESIKELAMGAFILPNKPIPDGADLRTFIAPVEAVERASGLELFNQDMKNKSKQLCAVTQCQIIVRRFDDARKDLGGKNGPKLIEARK